MTIARRQQIDPNETRWYHCLTRCVRRASLLKEGLLHRKDWIECRIKELAEIFAVGVGGFSVMDNHFHLLLRMDPLVAGRWTDEDIVRRWGRLFPPRDKSRKPLPVSESWVEERLLDAPWVASIRERLQSISWFMKCLKEPLARRANREDKVRGAFFESRFKCVGVLDEESLLAVSTYIDLNPVAAGVANLPEASEHTSIKARVEEVEAQGQTDRLQAARDGSVAGSLAAGGLEESVWLCPIEDRREIDSSREGMFVGFSLGSYLSLVDYTARLFREGKAAISLELASIFDRLGGSAASWQFRMKKLREGRLFGRFFAASREKLQDVAKRLGQRSVMNLCACLAR